ncbi:glycoside hydrolase family 88/105 protein [Botryobacter ruber]|uniref:glycoside hydrolase family 88/105 protein n=1 Tax=Botryobacter ruber TaxID=2171629 RepID=UPI0013E3B7AA|nr:glycoside hydrolase family 88 protein [Botryobacter ruber]
MAAFAAVLFATGFTVPAQSQQSSTAEDEQVIRKVADYILKEATFQFVDEENGKLYATTGDIPKNREAKFSSKYGEWHYTNGVVNMAMLHLADFLNEKKYADYAKKHVAFGFDNYKFFQKRFKGDRKHHQYPFGQLWTMQELDDCGAMGASVIEVYKREKRKEYKEYIDLTARHITERQDRLQDKTLVRKFPQEMTLWADDLYMSVPFLARMGNLTGDRKYFDDAVHQILSFDKYLWHPDKGIYYHCYYSDNQKNGVAHWGRSNGWIILAQTHLLSYLPKDHPKRQDVINNLQKQLINLSRYQDEKGLWHQLIDKPDSYAETSFSAMVVQGIAKAINEGWLDKRYASVALTGWDALKKEMIEADGQVKDICVGTGIRNDLVFYYTRPARPNEKHGVGSVIDAGVEVIKLKKMLEEKKS